jgi:acetyltransferase-like isoleucine patch superfamily enzyme
MSTSVIREGVSLEGAGEIQEFCLLGASPGAPESGAMVLRIGPGYRLRSHTVIYGGSEVGARFQTGHGVLIRELNKIGDDVSIGSHSIVEHHVRIGNRVRIHSNAFVPEFTILEDDVWIGPGVVLTNARYPASPDAKKNLKGPLVRRGARIGASSTILPGVVVGVECLVGAGSVVVRDVPDGVVVAGNPARVLRKVDEIQDYKKAIKASFKEEGP